MRTTPCAQMFIHRLIKTQIGHARNFTWYRGQRPSPARVILSQERVQIHARENLCSYATNPPRFSVRELLLCDILIKRAGDGRWPRYQAKSLACPGCVFITLGDDHHAWTDLNSLLGIGRQWVILMSNNFSLSIFWSFCIPSEKYLGSKQWPPNSHNDLKKDGAQLLLRKYLSYQ